MALESQEDYGLLEAIGSGNALAVERCLSARPDALTALRDQGSLVLHYAVQLGHSAVIAALLKDSAGRKLLDQFDAMSATPLSLAAMKNNYGIAKLLIEHGADVNAVESERAGNTAIREAVEEGSPELVKLLLSAGANPSIPGWMQMNALHKARQRHEKNPSPASFAILELLGISE